jgi:hypothetical protein
VSGGRDEDGGQGCFFVLEVVKAWIDPVVKNPRTVHHLGSGRFMVAGERIRLKSRAT